VVVVVEEEEEEEEVLFLGVPPAVRMRREARQSSHVSTSEPINTFLSHILETQKSSLSAAS
jgi:hypothetical protein